LSESLPKELYADLILYNCRIYTADGNDTIAEAIAVKNSRVQMIGTNSEILRLKGKSSEVMDLGGKLVLPGFVDSHEHCIRKGLQLDWVNCGTQSTKSIDDIVKALKRKAEEKRPGEWVVGDWFDESKLQERRFPTRYDLDKASRTHPIYLGRAGGHNGVANSLALEIASIGKDTDSPSGGRIEKDEEGEPTGRLDELAAMNIVRSKIPVPNIVESIKVMEDNWPKVEEELLSWGITTVHEAHIKAQEATAYQELLSRGKLRMRVGLMLDGMAPYSGYATNDLSRQGLRTVFGWGDKLKVIGVKLGVDGALGSHTAALKQPYLNEPGNRGIIRVTQEALNEETLRCHRAGLRVCIHAIGDWAIDVALDAIEEAVKKHPLKGLRHRIEHAGLVEKEQLERMARLGVAVSASIGFCFPIGDSHLDALGEDRVKHYYPMRSFRDHGIVAGGNSDNFGENWAITGIHGCVNRETLRGKVLNKDEAITITEAIKVYTINGAYLENSELEKGTLEVGKLADMVVLDRDILRINSKGIIDAKALMTFVGGELVYSR
jgi:predicted amidohydrolase YtcJ